MSGPTEPADAVASAIALVERFCADAATGDLDALVAPFTDDAVYHNIPMEPVVGPAAIRATIEGFTAAVDSIEFQVLAISAAPSAAGTTVLTERIDVFHFPGGHDLALPVMGAFDVDAANRITGWRDYFDLHQFMSQLPGA